jgi:nicotinamidase-related amidase
MSRHDTALLVVDVQDKILAAIADTPRIVWNTRRLIDGAKVLGLPVLVTEQYPERLGPTTALLAARLGPATGKLSFSCRPCRDLFEPLARQGVSKILLAGIETHVCVAQTALDLLSDGFRVYLAVDALGSRFEVDRQVALRRLEASGCTLTTTEAALFEWCAVAGTPEFKQISALVRETGPTGTNLE